MKVNKETVERAAALAMLNLTANETKSLETDFNKIISYFGVLNDLDTGNVVCESHAVSKKDDLREDKTARSYDRDILLSNAASTEAGGIKAPKILE